MILGVDLDAHMKRDSFISDGAHCRNMLCIKGLLGVDGDGF